MTCGRIRSKLPGYLDGALGADEHARVRDHVESCAGCRQELERYRKLSMLMARVDRADPPPDLVAQIRASIAQARATQPWPSAVPTNPAKPFHKIDVALVTCASGSLFGSKSRNGTGRVWSRAALLVENVLRPVAVPATGGVVAALFVFAVVFHTLLLGVPLGAVPNDVPTNLIQPARLESLAPFPVLGGVVLHGRPGPSLLLVEATLNAQGQVVDYQILSGPDGLAVRRQLDQVLLFSRFRPQMSFGRPTAGGRIVLSFSEIRVQG